jgi:heme/copper-type cytochrome/quinol oxidase subunit 2
MNTTATYEVSVGNSSLWIILLACGAAVLIIIGVAVWCYIKKKRNANQGRNAQLL